MPNTQKEGVILGLYSGYRPSGQFLATQERLTQDVGKVTHLNGNHLLDAHTNRGGPGHYVPISRPALIPRTDDRRPEGRLLWTPGGQNGTSTSVFFFCRPPDFLLPHTEDNRGG